MWPLVLVASGGALIWRQSLGSREPELPASRLPPRPSSRRRRRRRPRPRAEGLRGRVAAALDELRHEEGRRAALAVSRTGVGIALVIAAGLVFLQATGRAQRRARRAPVGARGGRRARRDLRALDRAARALADERARGADPLAGARRGRRPPARLGPADARDGAAPRGRPAGGRRHRAAPGARAARLARRAAGARRGGAARRPRSRRRPPRSRSATACPSRSWWWATATSIRRSRRSWPRRARR